MEFDIGDVVCLVSVLGSLRRVVIVAVLCNNAWHHVVLAAATSPVPQHLHHLVLGSVLPDNQSWYVK
jgi:hypothetical protein